MVPDPQDAYLEVSPTDRSENLVLSKLVSVGKKQSKIIFLIRSWRADSLEDKRQGGEALHYPWISGRKSLFTLFVSRREKCELYYDFVNIIQSLQNLK